MPNPSSGRISFLDLTQGVQNRTSLTDTNLLLSGDIYPPGGTVSLSDFYYTQTGTFLTSLTGTGSDGSAYQGASAAVSANGSTLVIGGWFDNQTDGAIWIFSNIAGVWTQQGEKISGADSSQFGKAVAISADGNTIAVGADLDEDGVGSVQVFFKESGVWAPQGGKLVGTGYVGGARQGSSVALSADGNTLVVGGPRDASFTGAAWVFSRTDGVWSQQTSKFVGGGAVGISGDASVFINTKESQTTIYVGPGPSWSAQTPLEQGGSVVTLSADARTFAVTSLDPFSSIVRIYSVSGLSITLQASLSAPSNTEYFGESLSLSANGTVLAVGAPGSTFGTIRLGRAYIYTRTGITWSLQSSIREEGTGSAYDEQGKSVSLSGSGNILTVGAPRNGAGRVRIYS